MEKNLLNLEKIYKKERFFMKKTCRRGQAPNNLLLDGSNGSGLRSGGHNLLLLLLLAGNQSGGGKGENSDGLHLILTSFDC